MLKRILPESINRILTEHVNLDKLYELRFRSSRPIMVNYGGQYYHLTENGVVKEFGDKVLFSDSKLLENIVVRASEHSLYAVNEQLKQGFVTIAGGVRIGISGDVVEEKGEVKTVKSFSSLNIRIPHEIKGCSLSAFKFIFSERLHNTLIVSPPGCGKTTFLRDLARNFSMLLPIVNTLIIDERSEIAACKDGKPQLDVGLYSDVVSNCTKEYGFLQGVRVMRPDLIITDELAGEKDLESVKAASWSGINVIASAHAKDIFDLTNKTGFEKILKNQVFSRFVLLSDRKGPGTYEGIYDADLKGIYFSGG